MRCPEIIGARVSRLSSVKVYLSCGNCVVRFEWARKWLLWWLEKAASAEAVAQSPGVRALLSDIEFSTGEAVAA